MQRQMEQQVHHIQQQMHANSRMATAQVAHLQGQLVQAQHQAQAAQVAQRQAQHHAQHAQAHQVQQQHAQAAMFVQQMQMPPQMPHWDPNGGMVGAAATGVAGGGVAPSMVGSDDVWNFMAAGGMESAQMGLDATGGARQVSGEQPPWIANPGGMGTIPVIDNMMPPGMGAPLMGPGVHGAGGPPMQPPLAGMAPPMMGTAQPPECFAPNAMMPQPLPSAMPPGDFHGNAGPGMLSGNRGGWMASPHHHLGAIWSESAGQNPAGGQNPHVWQPLPQGGSSGGGGRYPQAHFNGPRPSRSGALTIEAPPDPQQQQPKSQPQTATQPSPQASLESAAGDESDGVAVTAKSDVGAPTPPAELPSSNVTTAKYLVAGDESEAATADESISTSHIAAHSKPAAVPSGRPPSQQADQVTGVTYAGRSSTPPDTPAVPAATSPVAPSAAAPTSPDRAVIAERPPPAVAHVGGTEKHCAPPQTSSAPLGSRVAARGPQGARAQTASTSSTTASTTAGAEPAQRAALNLPPGLSGGPPPCASSTMGAEEGKKGVATGPVQLMPPDLVQLWRD